MVKLRELGECYLPEDVPGVLHAHAQRMREDRSELQHAWQDRTAGAPWEIVARELDKAAAAIERRIMVARHKQVASPPGRRMVAVHISVVWTEDSDTELSGPGVDSAVAEIARDMEGAIRSRFADWVEPRQAIVKALVVSGPAREGQ